MSISSLERAKRAKRTAYSRGAIRGGKDTVLPRRNSGWRACGFVLDAFHV
ncbi:hypothetical protein [Methanosarcina mazei]|nr:hypothetical protein [Methanosarcina mazei]